MDPVTLSLLGGSLAGQAIGGLFNVDAQRDAARANRQVMQDATNNMNTVAQGTYNQMGQMYNPYVQQGNDAFNQYAAFDPTVEMGEFNYGKSVNDFLDPSMAYQQDQARRQVEASNAAAGSLGSGAFAKELQERGMLLAQQDYSNAHQRMTNDKQFTYNDFMNRFNNTRANNQARMGQLQNISNVGQNAMGTMTNAGQNLANTQMNNIGSMANANAEYNNVNQMTTGSGMAGNLFTSLTNPQTVMGFANAFKG